LIFGAGLKELINNYKSELINSLNQDAMGQIAHLAESIKKAWTEGSTLYICGNGGSAGNAIHLANDFLYGAGTENKKGIKVEALSANSSVITCLANDIGLQ